MFNIFRKSKSKNSKPTSSNKPILRGSFDTTGVITLTHNNVVVCKGDVHDFNAYLRKHKIPRACIIWSEYDSIKESFWNSRYN